MTQPTNSTLCKTKCYNKDDIIRSSSFNTKKRGYKLKGKAANKVVSLYLEQAIQAVLLGQQWQFPGFGRLLITATSGVVKDYSYRKGGGYRRKFKYNFKRFNKVYSIKMESEWMQRYGMEFKAASTFRKMLYHVLTKTNINYPEK